MAIALVFCAAVTGAPATAAATSTLDQRVPLPVGFQPEGIASGELDGREYAFTGSLADGSLYRVDLTTGLGGVFSPPTGGSSVGLELDDRGRLFVAGGPGGFSNGDPGGGARVVDARTGALLASYELSATPSLINDVVVTEDAAWFTDSINPVLYRLPLGRDGELPAADDVQALPLSGEYQFDASASEIDGNGIEATPDGSALIAIQYRSGRLYRVNPNTGETRQVDLGGVELPEGDGLTLDGTRLYIPQNADVLNVVELTPAGDRGTLVAQVRDPAFDGLSTVARAGDRLYLPTARFTVPSPRTAEYALVSIAVP